MDLRTLPLRSLATVLVLIAIVGVIVFLESMKGPSATPSESATSVIAVSDTGDISAQERIARKTKEFSDGLGRAREISTPDGFINTDSISIGELIGKKVILVDFWTYSCINCQRTLPYLNAWNEAYADDGLVIIGIHTPEFEFEKDYENVKRAVEKWGVKYPVVLDNDYSTWFAYENRYWPRKYLIDIDGFVVYDHIGEGGYEEAEGKIVEALNERKEVLGEEKLVDMKSAPSNVDSVDFGKVGTPEMYFGYSRLEYSGNPPSQDCLNTKCSYTPPQEIAPNTFVIGGEWNVGKEQATFVGEDPGVIELVFSASKVNVVAGALNGVVKAEIYLDGELVSSGADVEGGVVEFSSHDLYNLIDLKGEYGAHLLVIRILEPGLETFAFTFG